MLLRNVLRTATAVGVRTRASVSSRFMSTTMVMSMPEYHDRADHALNALADALTLLEEELDDDDVDINYSVSDILSVLRFILQHIVNVMHQIHA